MPSDIGPIEGRYDPSVGPVEARWHGERGERGEKGEPGEGMTAGARRAIIFLFLFTLVLACANLYWNSRQTSQLQNAIDMQRHAVISQCKFDADLGGAPIAVNPATGKASLLGVTIVADGRQAFRGLHCPGHLAAPDPTFVRWARYYKLPLT